MKDYLRGLVLRARGEGAVIRPISQPIFTPAPGWLAPETRFDDPAPGYATRSAARARSRQIGEPSPSLPSPQAATLATGAPPITPVLSRSQPEAPVPPAAGVMSPAIPAHWQTSQSAADPVFPPLKEASATGSQVTPLIPMDDLAGDGLAPSESAPGATIDASVKPTLTPTAHPTTDPLDTGGEAVRTPPERPTPWEREHLARTGAPTPATTGSSSGALTRNDTTAERSHQRGEQGARAPRSGRHEVDFAASSTFGADAPLARLEPGTGPVGALPAAAPARATTEERPSAEERPSTAPQPVGRHDADLANYDSDPVPVVAQVRLAALASPRPPAAAPGHGWNDDAPAPTIHVSIGRIEVRAMQPPAPAPPRAPSGPRVSLDDYLRQRDGREGR